MAKNFPMSFDSDVTCPVPSRWSITSFPSTLIAPKTKFSRFLWKRALPRRWNVTRFNQSWVLARLSEWVYIAIQLKKVIIARRIVLSPCPIRCKNRSVLLLNDYESQSAGTLQSSVYQVICLGWHWKPHPISWRCFESERYWVTASLPLHECYQLPKKRQRRSKSFQSRTKETMGNKSISQR